jgi:hypothetical protein
MSLLSTLHLLVNASSRCLLSQAEIETLNPHRCHPPPSLNRLTPILHCYKKIISIFISLHNTQQRHHFVFSLAKTQRHQSFTRCRHSLLPSSHIYCPSAQLTPTMTNYPTIFYFPNKLLKCKFKIHRCCRVICL